MSRSLLRGACVALVVLLTSCSPGPGGSDSGTTDSGTITPLASKSIGSAGGSISAPDNSIVITVPAGALSTDVTISLAKVPASSRPTDTLAGLAYTLEPSGTTFAVPLSVKLTAPKTALSDSAANASDDPVYLGSLLVKDAAGTVSALTDLSITQDDAAGTVSFTGGLSHFSTVWLASLTSSGQGKLPPLNLHVGETAQATIVLYDTHPSALDALNITSYALVPDAQNGLTLATPPNTGRLATGRNSFTMGIQCTKAGTGVFAIRVTAGYSQALYGVNSSLRYDSLGTYTCTAGGTDGGSTGGGSAVGGGTANGGGVNTGGGSATGGGSNTGGGTVSGGGSASGGGTTSATSIWEANIPSSAGAWISGDTVYVVGNGGTDGILWTKQPGTQGPTQRPLTGYRSTRVRALSGDRLMIATDDTATTFSMLDSTRTALFTRKANVNSIVDLIELTGGSLVLVDQRTLSSPIRQAGGFTVMDNTGAVTVSKVLDNTPNAAPKITAAGAISNNRFVLLGEKSIGFLQVQPWVALFDATGAITWQNLYGTGSQEGLAHGIAQLPSGNLLVSGFVQNHIDGGGQGPNSVLLMELNVADGSIVRQTSLGTGNTIATTRVLPMSNGDVVVGWNEGPFGSVKTVLTRLDSTWNFIWAERYTDAITTSSLGLLTLAEASDHGLIVVNRSTGSPGSRTYVMKTLGDGTLGVCTLTTVATAVNSTAITIGNAGATAAATTFPVVTGSDPTMSATIAVGAEFTPSNLVDKCL